MRSKKNLLKRSLTTMAVFLVFAGIIAGQVAATTVVFRAQKGMTDENWEKWKSIVQNNVIEMGEDIKIEFIPGRADVSVPKEREEVATIMVTGQEVPDITSLTVEDYAEYVTAGWLDAEALMKYMPENFWNRLFPVHQRIYAEAWGNKYYAVPWRFGVGVLYVRKDLLKKYGYNVTPLQFANNTSLGNLIDAAKKISEKENVPYGLIAPHEGGSFDGFFFELLRAFDGYLYGGKQYLYGPVGDRPVTVVDTPEVMMTLKTWQDLFLKHQIMPKEAINWTNSDAMRVFGAEKAVFMRLWNFGITQLEPVTGLSSDKWGATPLYNVMDPYGHSSMGGWWWGVNPNSKHKRAAVKAIQAAAKPDSLLFLINAMGALPPYSALFTPEKIQDVSPRLAPYARTISTAVEYANERPFSPVYGELRELLIDVLKPMLIGQYDVKEAARRLEAGIKKIEGEYKK